jgi:transcriptional regulator with XRE-family HTH domain
VYEKTDDELLRLLGGRLRQYRLQRNITQADLARSIGLHENTVSNAEEGKDPRLSTIVKMLRGLQRLESLDSFLPPAPLSPIQVARLQHKTRKIARKPRKPAERRNGG